jgi:site-specific DNA recombinase
MPTTQKAIPAAGYVRMSSDKQETSPEQQRQEIERYAKREGYRVLRWYTDEGISGDDTERRIQFKRMIGDASTGEFEVILCWDQDRFGRFDLLEAGKWISPLREVGVRLETVTQGRIDWTELAGRMMYGIQQEFKHQYLRDLSKNVTRGLSQLAQAGKWAGGMPPIGYLKGPDAKLHLGSPEDVEFVRWLFAEYVRGHSIRGIAQQLARAGRLSPKKKRWTSSGIRSVLRNPVYQGHSVWNRLRSGRYKRSPGQQKRRDETEWIVVENTHPAIISPELWKNVQDKLTTNNRRDGVSRRSDSPFVLSGLLFCGQCGYRMIGGADNGTPHYKCYSYLQNGSCNRNYFHQSFLVAEILRIL